MGDAARRRDEARSRNASREAEEDDANCHPRRFPSPEKLTIKKKMINSQQSTDVAQRKAQVQADEKVEKSKEKLVTPTKSAKKTATSMQPTDFPDTRQYPKWRNRPRRCTRRLPRPRKR